MPFSEPNFFRTLAENSADIICYVGMDSVLQYVSPSCRAILGCEPEELVGTGPEALVHPEDLATLQQTAQMQRESGASAPPVTVRARHKDGVYRWLEMEARTVQEPGEATPSRLVLVMRDVTQRKQWEDRLAALAVTDGLTGLLNRRGFDAELDRAWHETLRRGSQMSLLLLDVDHFKAFNDSYGHQVGDDCLRSLSAAVQAALLHEGDKAARYGGEEIGIVLPRAGADEAMAVAERVRQAVLDLALPHPRSEAGGGLVSVSIGVASALARHGGTMRMPESLLLSADAALYRAKREGRNRVALTLLMASMAS